MRRIRRSMSQNIIYPQLIPACPSGDFLFVQQICGREKAKMQSVYRGSVKYFLDFFQIRGLHVLLTGFLSASLPVAVFFLFSPYRKLAGTNK